VREHYSEFDRWLSEQSAETMRDKRAEADLVFRRVGITFAVYGEKDEEGIGTERLIPFDVVPRVIPAVEWRQLEAGLRQRVRALNRYIYDVYTARTSCALGVSRPTRSSVTRNTGPRCMASASRVTSIRTSPASMSCAPEPASSMF